jgi:hypothetical protein
MLDNTNQDDTHARGKSRRDLEYAPYRALDMTALTPAAKASRNAASAESCCGSLHRGDVDARQQTSTS